MAARRRLSRAGAFNLSPSLNSMARARGVKDGVVETLRMPRSSAYEEGDLSVVLESNGAACTLDAPILAAC